MPPILGEGGSNDRKQAEDSSDEDSSATTDDVVERVGKPAATVRRRKFDIYVNKIHSQTGLCSH